MKTDIRVEEIMVRDVVCATVPRLRDEVLEILRSRMISGVPVVKDGELVGIVTRTDLLENPEEEQVALLMTRNPVTVNPGADLTEAANLILKNRVRRLPVVEDHHLVGLVTTADIVGAIADMDIKDPIEPYLGDGILTVWDETPLTVVGMIMELANVHAVPVLDRDRKLVGIIGDKDLIVAASIEDSVEKSDMSSASDEDEWTWEGMRDTMRLYYGVSRIEVPNIPVRDAMVTDLITAVKTSEVSECARKMRRNAIDQIPVVSNQKIVGLLIDSDLLKPLVYR